MRSLNEPIARAANLEDHVTGRFWERRFKFKALLDENALAACIAYVDLNPLRAKMALSPDGVHISIQRRIETARAAPFPEQPDQHNNGMPPLVGNRGNTRLKILPFRMSDYLELVDSSGRVLREGKCGHIPAELPNILQCFELDMDVLSTGCI